ncbi:hypothetical protein DLREEDagrD3_22370 [Denitratisoma sp. agr-D3]
MGALSDIGGCGCFDSHLYDVALVRSAWLQGEYSVSYSDELVFEAFLPYPGKTFSDGVLHSARRARNAITQLIIIHAKTTILLLERGMTLHSVVAEIRARRYATRMLAGDTARACITSVLGILRRQIAVMLTR